MLYSVETEETEQGQLLVASTVSSSYLGTYVRVGPGPMPGKCQPHASLVQRPTVAFFLAYSRLSNTVFALSKEQSNMDY
jgi:hypothetical protein